ncbi:MAG TPA: hypothetical protein VF523_10985, partial [Burkholderiales bacterium]
MPWTRDHFPAAMRNLDPEVRDKAVEIANALLREGHDEGFAIRVAIARAADWGRLHALLSALRADDPS